MGFKKVGLSSQLQLTIPTSGTVNYGATLESGAWQPIAEHDHTSGKGVQLSAGSIANGSLTGDKIAPNLALTLFANSSLTGAAAPSIDWANGNYQTIDFATATSVAFSFAANALTAQAAKYVLLITYGSNTVTVTWPANVKWPQGVPLDENVLPTTDNAVHKVEFFYDGTNYYADWNREYS